MKIEAQNKQYNYCLDFMKGIACLFVVWMHCEFPGKTGIIVQAISRFCVPFFFMVSGFFCVNMSKAAMGGNCLIINKKVQHILKITIWASLFYLVWAVIRDLVWHDRDISLSLGQAVAWLVFNQPVIIGGHIWFLFALLYDYILVSVFDGKKIHNKQYLFGSISLVLLYVLGQGVHLAGVHIPNYIYRNWLIEGLAFFMLGRWIKENKDKVTFSNTALIIIVVVSSLLCLVERRLVGRDFGVNICTLPQVFALFLYAVKNSERHAGLIQRIGRDCSMLVYVLHIFIWQAIGYVYVALGINENTMALYMLPIAVVIVSILMALLFNWTVLKLKKETQIVIK